MAYASWSVVFGEQPSAAKWNIIGSNASDADTRISAIEAAAYPPTGSIISYGGSSAPTSWLICDGSAISRVTYSALFAVLSTTYGSGNGSTTFNIPDFKGRIPVGKNTGTFVTLGATGGAETHTLVTAELAAHSHTGTTASSGSHAHNYTAPDTAITVNAINPVDTALGHVPNRSAAVTDTQGAHTHTFTTANAGSGSAHNNIQPYQVINYIIRT